MGQKRPKMLANSTALSLSVQKTVLFCTFCSSGACCGSKGGSYCFWPQEKLLLQYMEEFMKSTDNREKKKCSKYLVRPLPLLRCRTWYFNASKQIYYCYKHEIRKLLWKFFPFLCPPVSFLILPFPSQSFLLVFFLSKRSDSVHRFFFPLSFIILIPFMILI